MTKGFTSVHLANRIKAVDFDVSIWKTYTALCALAAVRGMKKRAIADQVFGKGVKTSKTFDNSWSIAQKLYANGMSLDLRVSISEMGIEDAQQAASNALEAHMTTVGVKGKNEYEKYAIFSSMEERQHFDEQEAKRAEELKAEEDAAAQAEADQAAAKPETEKSPAGEIQGTSETLVSQAVDLVKLLQADELGQVLAQVLSQMDASSLNDAAKLVNNARKLAIAAQDQAQAA